METHKRVLGILFIVLASLQILVMVFLNFFFTTVFAFALSQAETKDAPILEMIMNLVRFIPVLVIFFMAIPGLIAGIGLLNQKSWAMILALVIGCLNLFSFPFGTALGIYTIWVYAEDHKQSTVSPG